MVESELFVVRVWRQLSSGFRASVRRVDEDQTHHFSRPEEMALFLASAPVPRADTDAANQSSQSPGPNP